MELVKHPPYSIIILFLIGLAASDNSNWVTVNNPFLEILEPIPILWVGKKGKR